MNDYLRDRVTVAVGAQYLIEREIGRGGMAVVYRATDLRLNRPVAIKVLPPDLAFNSDVRTRFIREAQTAAQLSHPNIVPIYSVDEKQSEHLVYFVMGYVDGESLGVRLASEGAWPIDASVRVLRDVADALAYAHASGVRRCRRISRWRSIARWRSALKIVGRTRRSFAMRSTRHRARRRGGTLRPCLRGRSIRGSIPHHPRRRFLSRRRD